MFSKSLLLSDSRFSSLDFSAFSNYSCLFFKCLIFSMVVSFYLIVDSLSIEVSFILPSVSANSELSLSKFSSLNFDNIYWLIFSISWSISKNLCYKEAAPWAPILVASASKLLLISCTSDLWANSKT